MELAMPSIELYDSGYHVSVPSISEYATVPYGKTDTLPSSYRLLFCVKGQLILRSAKGMYIAKKGDILLLRAESPCEYRPGASHQFYRLDVGGAGLDALLPAQLLQAGVVSLHTLPKSLLGELSSLLCELCDHAPCAKEAAMAHLVLLFSHLCRLCEGMDPAARADLQKLLPALTAIEWSYATDYSVAQYADMCGLSEYHFIRCFRKCKGMPPIAYRTAVRMRAARELLSQTDLSVSEIARRVGYEDAVHFGKQFRSVCGLCAREYRRAQAKR